MSNRIADILRGNIENHILPFFWLHGEEEVVLREYMRVINEAHIGAVCVESRPHPDFVGEKWWEDMDIILEEARKRQMKVWILDDSHFPTGYANGAMDQAPVHLRRKNVCYQGIDVKKRVTDINVERFLARKEKKEGLFDKLTVPKKKSIDVPEDALLSVTAFRLDQWETPIDLTKMVQNGHIKFEAPKGKWRIGLCKVSYRCGMHENYINMLNPESVKILINTVYEPHYEHYKEDFGTTIAGFFSDEPELGNGPLYKYGKNLGTSMEQPWSETLIPMLEKSLGNEWMNYLPLIWDNDADKDMTARVRYAFMDSVTRNVQIAFSNQIGDWCRAHQVSYIGHMIEDNNQHCRTGSSLGHYFRGLSGQDMAGIDDIGGQVNPGQEDGPDKYFVFMPRDGEFYHYALGKLAGSMAAIDPSKHGNAMCEIFGNYGWGEGFRLEKYLADHFMVRGINHFVPHAFSAKPFPDSDCPPHFYANGHNPEYRHFSSLMDYMNRVSALISDGHHKASVALLYHGEAEWTGECMLLQKPARQLADHQIDFDIIPTDVFAETEYYRVDLSEKFVVNSQEYKALVIPYAEYVSKYLIDGIQKLQKINIPVFILGEAPSGVYDGEIELLETLKNCKYISLDGLVDELESREIPEIHISPSNHRIRVMHYQNGYDMFYFVNEGEEEYQGKICLPMTGRCGIYRAEWNRLEEAGEVVKDNHTFLDVKIPTRQSLIVLFDNFDGVEIQTSWTKQILHMQQKAFDGDWKRSLCRAIEYPNFGVAKKVTLPDEVSKETPKFSGIIRYENSFSATRDNQKLCLEITDAYEGVEVFVNGESAGIQIVPAYCFDLTHLVRKGTNEIVIEISTTLERERRGNKESPLERLQRNKVMNPTGITGSVILYE